MSKLPLINVLNGIINRKPLFIPFQQVCGKSIFNLCNTCGKLLVTPLLLLVNVVSNSVYINSS